MQLAAIASVSPGILVHESAHAAAAKPWAERLWLMMDPKPCVAMDLEATTPWWAIVLIGIAPFLIGLATAPAMLWVLFSLPPVIGVLIGIWWAVVAIPSGDDWRMVLHGLHRRQQPHGIRGTSA